MGPGHWNQRWGDAAGSKPARFLEDAGWIGDLSDRKMSDRKRVIFGPFWAKFGAQSFTGGIGGALASSACSRKWPGAGGDLEFGVDGLASHISEDHMSDFRNLGMENNAEMTETKLHRLINTQISLLTGLAILSHWIESGLPESLLR